MGHHLGETNPPPDPRKYRLERSPVPLRMDRCMLCKWYGATVSALVHEYLYGEKRRFADRPESYSVTLTAIEYVCYSGSLGQFLQSGMTKSSGRCPARTGHPICERSLVE